MELSVIVPIYNEIENLHDLHQELTQTFSGLPYPYELVLVDDGSTDGSRQVLAELAERDPHVRAVLFRRNFGQTAALQAGFEYARGSVLVLMDGDLQNDPRDVPAMLTKLHEGYDLIHGWRTPRRDPFLSRQLPSRIANWLISRVTRFPIHDLGCTLKVIRREVVDDMELYGQMHRFIPILAHVQGARCCEIVTHHRPRLKGTTKYGIGRTWQVVLDLITVRYLQRFCDNPMRLFGSMGLAATLASFALLTLVIAMKTLGGIDMTGNPLLLASGMALMFGLQFFSVGLLGELCARMYFSRGGERPFKVSRVLGGDTPWDPSVRVHREAA